MERRQTLLAKEDLHILEYDLNVFYADLGTEDDDGNNQWEDVYTIQPCIYFIVKDTWMSYRMYMEAFKLDLAETRAIAPDFPMEEWGDDFFISLEYFVNTCKTLPESLSSKLDRLPPIESHVLQTSLGPEIQWL
jgi:hypothetical protein